MDDNNNTFSFIVVSDDNLSKKFPVKRSTLYSNFYNLIMKYFNQNIYNLKFFYFEAYSHNKVFISNEKEFVIANKKSIEYLYFYPYQSNDIINEEDNYYDYLKYHSVLVFSPIKLLNTEFQKNLMKKMKINSDNKKINLNNNMNKLEQKKN